MKTEGDDNNVIVTFRAATKEKKKATKLLSPSSPRYNKTKKRR
jgi:hypothetical protein